MPLDTAPLSPARRFVSTVVLLVMLGASLGLAALIVKAREGHESAVWNDGVKITFPTPSGWQVKHTDNGGNADYWQNKSMRGSWIMLRFDGTFANVPPSNWEGQLLAGVEHMMGDLQVRPPTTMPFGGATAQLFIGQDAAGEMRVLVGAAIVRDHSIQLVLSGDNRTITDAEVTLFKSIFAEAQVTIDGEPHRTPKAATVPKTATRPQTRP